MTGYLEDDDYVYFREDEGVCFETTVTDIDGKIYELIDDFFTNLNRWNISIYSYSPRRMYYVYERKEDGKCFIVVYQPGAQKSEYCDIEYDDEDDCWLVKAYKADSIVRAVEE